MRRIGRLTPRHPADHARDPHGPRGAATTDTNANHDDLHARGLQFDLTVVSRRRARWRALGVLAAGAPGYYALRGGPFDGTATVMGTASDGSTCVADPTETAGPFPGDGTNAKDGQTINVLTESGVIRQDIRTSFGAVTAVADGVPMKIPHQAYRCERRLCAPGGPRDLCLALRCGGALFDLCDRRQ